MALRVFASTAASRLGISLLPRTFATVVGDLMYSDSHEWVKVEGNSATVGITDHAQGHLGDVVYVELPEEGASVAQGYVFGAIESVKASSDINSPISGKVVEVNKELEKSPALINGEPYGQGWMMKVEITDSDEFENLMDSEKYSKFCEEEDAANH
ncbi:glycine cleavage system H protein 2, mitochondrial-like [Silene latifolia]|uniref:glycine cleavage system H protein 2, mitochondrial-like n=1 Tax=Silene latifolia TaxID=37657 RepID=UPI003D7885AC